MMTGWMVGRSIRPCSTSFTLGSPSTTALPNDKSIYAKRLTVLVSAASFSSRSPSGSSAPSFCLDSSRARDTPSCSIRACCSSTLSYAFARRLSVAKNPKADSGFWLG